MGSYVKRNKTTGFTLGDNSDIVSISLKKNVSSIKSGEFSGYTNLKKLVIHNDSNSLNIEDIVTNNLDSIEVGRNIKKGGIVTSVSTIFPNASKIIPTNGNRKNLGEFLKDFARTLRSFLGTDEPIEPNKFGEKLNEIKLLDKSSGWGYSVVRNNENNITLGETTDIVELGISSNITSIKSGELDKYSSLETLRISSGDPLNILSNNKCPKSVVDLTLGRNITFSGDSPFKGPSVKNLVLTGNITKLNDGMFKNSVNIDPISIPTTITEIGKEAFSCDNYTYPNDRSLIFRGASESSSDLPGSLDIKEGAFYKSGVAGEVIFPINVRIIEKDAFRKNEVLEKICFQSKDDYYYFGIQLGNNAFTECPNLKKIYLPRLTQYPNELWVQTDGSSLDKSPFYSGSDILTVQFLAFPENLQKIQDRLLGENDPSTTRGVGLRYIKMPKELKSIGIDAFNPGYRDENRDYQPTEYDFSEFTGGEPPTLALSSDGAQQSFYGHIDKMIIIVPNGGVYSWSNAPGWNKLLYNDDGEPMAKIVSVGNYTFKNKPDDVDNYWIGGTTTTTTSSTTSTTTTTDAPNR